MSAAATATKRGRDNDDDDDGRGQTTRHHGDGVHVLAAAKVEDDEEFDTDTDDASSSDEEAAAGAMTMSAAAAAALPRPPTSSHQVTEGTLSTAEQRPFSQFIVSVLREEQLVETQKGKGSELTARATQARMRVRDLLLSAATAPLAGGGARQPFESRGPRSYFALNPSLGTPLLAGGGGEAEEEEGGLAVEPFVVLYETSRSVDSLTPDTLRQAVEAVTVQDVQDQREALDARHARARGRAKTAAAAMSEAQKNEQSFVEAVLTHLRKLLTERVVDVQFVERVGRKAQHNEALPTTAAMMDAIREWAKAAAAARHQRERKAKALRVLRTSRDDAASRVEEFMEREGRDARFFELRYNNQLMRLRVKRKVRPAKYGKRPTLPWIKRHGAAFFHGPPGASADSGGGDSGGDSGSDGAAAAATVDIANFMHGTEAARKAFVAQFLLHAKAGFDTLQSELVAPERVEMVVQHARKRRPLAGGHTGSARVRL